MELSNILLIILSVVPFVYHFHRKLFKLRNADDDHNIKLPPGRLGLPFIGESLAYYFKIRKGCLFEFVKERMDKYSSKIFKTNLLMQPMVMLCNVEGNKFLFSNEDKLFKVWWPDRFDQLFPMSGNLSSTEISRWIRFMILPLFLKPDALQGNVGIMDAVMRQHLETYWIGKDEVKVKEMVKKYTLALSWTVLNRGIKASKILRSKIEAIIRQRKLGVTTSRAKEMKRYFILHMLSKVDEHGHFFKEQDIASHLAGLFLAAYSTVYSAISMLMKVLAEYPSVYEAILQEQKDISHLKEPGSRLNWEDFRRMKYSWNVVYEVFRLHGSTSGFKEATTDFTYEGYTIPKGWKIHWAVQAIHKSPKYFPNPEKFDPSRFEGDSPAPYTFNPFGGGPRMCPGSEYTRLEILTFLHYVVTEFRWEKLIPDEKVSHIPFTSPAQGLPIRLYRLM